MEAGHSPAAQRYIDLALKLIDRDGGSRGVNLREVARELGCAHTNAYNYFNGLEELLAQSLVAVLERQAELSERALSRPTRDPRKRLAALIESQVEFALAHPGWYRFAWLEPLPGPPLPRALEVMEQAGAGIARLVSELAAGAISPARSAQVAEDLHTWLHGALAKAVTGRVRSSTPTDVRAELTAGARRLCRDLIANKRSG